MGTPEGRPEGGRHKDVPHESNPLREPLAYS